MTSLWKAESYLRCSGSHPRKLVTLNPKLKSTSAGRYQLLSVGGMPTASSLAWKTSLPKSQDAVALQQIKERGALHLWLIVVISVRQSTVAAISGLHCRALVMVSSSIKAVQNSKKQAERSERLMYEQSHRDYLRSGYLHHRLSCLSWAVNHYRDNAITYKAQRDKKCQWSAGERGNYWHADASAWCCRSIPAWGVSWC